MPTLIQKNIIKNERMKRKMKILVVNCGSSSLKYQLIDMEKEEVMAKGNYERIGENSFLTHKVNGEKIVIEEKVSNHEEALKIIVEQLLSEKYNTIRSLDEIQAVGHRIVHGGEYFDKSVLVTEDVIEKIEACSKLAPLHNPAAVMGIRACQKQMPNAKMAVVFDTAFHQTMPAKAFTYPVPYEMYEKYGVRKYGAHGTSHKYISNRVAALEGRTDLKIVNCHLGQGASLCAMKDGKSLDTSMGLTPLGGIPMCARSGDLDPSVVTYIMNQANLNAEEVEKLLNKQSGVFGISGVSADFRDIEGESAKGNERASLALDVYAYRVAQFIASYSVTLQGIDVITFTAGVGENQFHSRKKICDNLKYMGLEIDEEKNKIRGEEILISTPNSKIKVYIIPTDEEMMIAKDTLELVK